MYFQFDMTNRIYPRPDHPANSSADPAELLGQMLEIQREQLGHLRSLVAAQDAGARWRAFVARWRQDFPELPEACRQAVPILERTYNQLMEELTSFLSQNGPEALENDFGLQDFLDRFGMKLAQLGTILNLVAPLAETGSPSESA